MPKVTLTVSRSGADGAFAPGETIEVSKDEAERMIAAGQAIAAPVPQERATKKPVLEKRTK